MPPVERWVLHAVNAMLGLLVMYLGWTVGSEILDLRESAVRDAAEPVAASAREPVTAQTAAPPLQRYRVVWKRNLFGVAPPAVATRDKVDLENIALAGSDIGLKLIGTAVGKDPARNYAIIETLSTRKQLMYQEQERVGKVLIRAILRNNVVVENEDGSRRRLSVDDEPGRGGRAAVQAVAPATPQPQTAEMPGVFQVRLAEVPASPEDVRKTVEELKLTPQTEDGALSGFSVGRLRAKDVLWQAGIRTGDVIKGVDDEEFQSPQDLEYFFQRLARGGDVSITAERRGRPVRLNVKIE
jgi:type II secretion system protein C